VHVFHESISPPVEMQLSLSNPNYAIKSYLSCSQEAGKQDCNTVRITAAKKVQLLSEIQIRRFITLLPENERTSKMQQEMECS